ncbi:hypothetical protein N9L19_01270 [bacterium]|nr:hypothetical protein [bacterium]
MKLKKPQLDFNTFQFDVMNIKRGDHGYGFFAEASNALLHVDLSFVKAVKLPKAPMDNATDLLFGLGFLPNDQGGAPSSDDSKDEETVQTKSDDEDGDQSDP